MRRSSKLDFPSDPKALHHVFKKQGSALRIRTPQRARAPASVARVSRIDSLRARHDAEASRRPRRARDERVRAEILIRRRQLFHSLHRRMEGRVRDVSVGRAEPVDPGLHGGDPHVSREGILRGPARASGANPEQQDAGRVHQRHERRVPRVPRGPVARGSGLGPGVLGQPPEADGCVTRASHGDRCPIRVVEPALADPRARRERPRPRATAPADIFPNNGARRFAADDILPHTPAHRRVPVSPPRRQIPA